VGAFRLRLAARSFVAALHVRTSRPVSPAGVPAELSGRRIKIAFRFAGAFPAWLSDGTFRRADRTSRQRFTKKRTRPRLCEEAENDDRSLSQYIHLILKEHLRRKEESAIRRKEE